MPDKHDPSGQDSPEEILGPESTLEGAQELKESYGNRVLKDFKQFIEKHMADFGDDEPDSGQSELEFLAQMFEKPPVDEYTFYQDFYQSNIDNRKYKADPEYRKIAEKYVNDMVTLLVSRRYKSGPNIKFVEDPEEKWVQHTVNGGFDTEHMGRFYLNLKPEEAVGFYKKALEESVRRGIHVDMKMVRKAKVKCFNQRDKMVIYFDGEEEQQVLEALQELYKNNEGAFDDTGVPAFALEVKDKEGNIMNGVGFGEEPFDAAEEGKSFGLIRSKILFDIYEEIRTLKKENPAVNIPFEKYRELFLKYCRDNSWENSYWVDPENPAFNATERKDKPFSILRSMA